MRCENCNRELFKDSTPYWSAWSALFSQIEILCSQDSITEQTRDLMIDKLLMLKVLVSDKEDADSKLPDDSKPPDNVPF